MSESREQIIRNILSVIQKLPERYKTMESRKKYVSFMAYEYIREDKVKDIIDRTAKDIEEWARRNERNRCINKIIDFAIKAGIFSEKDREELKRKFVKEAGGLK